MKLLDYIIVGILLAWLIFSIIRIFKKKNIGCGGSCSKCCATECKKGRPHR